MGHEVHIQITACAIKPYEGNPQWRILISDFLSPEDHACVLMYEKAHLPPNNWMDEAWENHAWYGSEYRGRVDGEVKPYVAP